MLPRSRASRAFRIKGTLLAQMLVTYICSSNVRMPSLVLASTMRGRCPPSSGCLHTSSERSTTASRNTCLLPHYRTRHPFQTLSIRAQAQMGCITLVTTICIQGEEASALTAIATAIRTLLRRIPPPRAAFISHSNSPVSPDRAHQRCSSRMTMANRIHHRRETVAESHRALGSCLSQTGRTSLAKQVISLSHSHQSILGTST